MREQEWLGIQMVLHRIDDLEIIRINHRKTYGVLHRIDDLESTYQCDPKTPPVLHRIDDLENTLSNCFC